MSVERHVVLDERLEIVSEMLHVLDSVSTVFHVIARITWGMTGQNGLCNCNYFQRNSGRKPEQDYLTFQLITNCAEEAITVTRDLPHLQT